MRYLILLPLLLAGCAEASGDNNVAIAANSDSGEVEVALPGIKAKLDLPPGLLKGGSVDLGGVDLFPGSTVKTVNVDTRNPDTPVVIGFTAPGTVEAVRRHFVDGFAAKAVTLSQTGTALAGVMSDGDRITIDLTPAGGTTDGRITIAEKR